jgi:hypothetical protein
MSEYKNIILKMNPYLSKKTIITDIGSSKIETSKIIKKFLKKILFGHKVIQLLDLRLVGQKMEGMTYSKINGVF